MRNGTAGNGNIQSSASYILLIFVTTICKQTFVHCNCSDHNAYTWMEENTHYESHKASALFLNVLNGLTGPYTNLIGASHLAFLHTELPQPMDDIPCMAYT
jgi:hypothetical protein